MVSKEVGSVSMAAGELTDQAESSIRVTDRAAYAGSSSSAVETAPAPAPRKQDILSKPILKRFAVNVASLFSLHVANMLLPLLTVPYVVRIIGPERLGLLNFSQAFVAYFTLLINYGFDMASVRAIAANRDNAEVKNRVFSEVIFGKSALWVVSTIIFAVISSFVDEFRAHYWLHICTYIGTIGIVFFPVWLYQAMENLGRVALFNTIIKVLVTLTVFIFIQQPEDYVYQNLSLSLSQVMVSFVAFFVAVKRFNIHFSWPTMAQMTKRFRDDSTLFFTSVVATIYAGSNIFLLGMFSTPYNVGIFSAGTRIVGIAQAFVSLALNQAFFPIVANAFGQSEEKGLTIVRTIFFPVTLLMMLVSAGIWLIAPIFISMFYGAKFEEAVLVLRIVALLPITLGLNNLFGVHTMLSLRMDKAFFRISAVGSIVSLSLNALFIQRFGHVGVACSWVITEAFVTTSFYVYLRYKGIEVVKLSYLQEAITFSKSRLAVLFKQQS
ncbi:flippase [Spirosoma fluviale]|uniref:Polysaccharide transporter, PST family n=1 Tax=Spirosoma fluviale TaxID=1597977 RepID=A0A286G9Y3_9BACT|nr:flippase [Spirosoma fluviale]SOD92036.1 polysaccharide transporter, PST family [Spirosoma fluviale]